MRELKTFNITGCDTAYVVYRASLDSASCIVTGVEWPIREMATQLYRYDQPTC